MKNVFRVTIWYYGGTESEVNVIAANDVKARAAAIAEDVHSFTDENLKQPKVEFCEIEFICQATVA